MNFVKLEIMATIKIIILYYSSNDFKIVHIFIINTLLLLSLLLVLVWEKLFLKKNFYNNVKLEVENLGIKKKKNYIFEYLINYKFV